MPGDVVAEHGQRKLCKEEMKPAAYEIVNHYRTAGNSQGLFAHLRERLRREVVGKERAAHYVECPIAKG